MWKGSELVLQIALLKIKGKLNLSCVCSGWVCNLLELSEEAWQHTRLTAPGHRIQGSSVTLPFWVPSLALIGTSLEINENDILCSSCSRRRMLQKGPSQFITHSIYIAMALKHYLWDVNFLSAVNNLNRAEEEWKKHLESMCVWKQTNLSTSENCCVWIAGTPFSVVNCCSSQQSPAALSNLSKIPCSVKEMSSAASPLSGQGLEETGEPIQQPPTDLWASVKHQSLSLSPFQKSCALLDKSN